jgi:hypothetical protein
MNLAKVLWFFLSRKNFFFEKKKQKTFANLGGLIAPPFAYWPFWQAVIDWPWNVKMLFGVSDWASSK